MKHLVSATTDAEKVCHTCNRPKYCECLEVAERKLEGQYQRIITSPVVKIKDDTKIWPYCPFCGGEVRQI